MAKSVARNLQGEQLFESSLRTMTFRGLDLLCRRCEVGCSDAGNPLGIVLILYKLFN